MEQTQLLLCWRQLMLVGQSEEPSRVEFSWLLMFKACDIASTVVIVSEDFR